MSLSELIIDIPAEYEMNVFGQFDTYIKKIERTFHVTLISRDGATKIQLLHRKPSVYLHSLWNLLNEEIQLRNRM